MRPGMSPASMSVAPNSPSARAKERIVPASSPGAASGTTMRRKTRHSEAPSVRAACSSGDVHLRDRSPRGEIHERKRNHSRSDHSSRPGENHSHADAQKKPAKRPVPAEKQKEQKADDSRRQNKREQRHAVKDGERRSTAPLAPKCRGDAENQSDGRRDDARRERNPDWREIREHGSESAVASLSAILRSAAHRSAANGNASRMKFLYETACASDALPRLDERHCQRQSSSHLCGLAIFRTGLKNPAARSLGEQIANLG